MRMDQLISMIDAEQAVINELSGTYTIATKLQTAGAPALRVVATPGNQTTLVSDQFALVLEAYHPRESSAFGMLSDAIARLSLAARRGSIGGFTAYGLGAATPQNLPNPTVPNMARYISTITPVFRRQVVTIYGPDEYQPVYGDDY